MPSLFTDEQVRQLERMYPDGVSASEVVGILHDHGVDLAEATFRKYVQLGLLPRSRRVGRKGKHQGSHGLYPVDCVIRIAEIRQLMDAGLTLEDIQRSAVAYRFEVDTLRRTADDILGRLTDELASRPSGKSTSTSRKLESLRVQAEALANAIEQAANDICPIVPMTRQTPSPVNHGARPARSATAAKISKKRPGERPGPNRAGANR